MMRKVTMTTRWAERRTVTPPSAGRLRDRQLAEASIVAASATVDEASQRAGGCWLVVVASDGGLLGALHPERLSGHPAHAQLMSLLPDLPPTVIAAADVSMRVLADSWAFQQLEPDSVVVAVAGGDVVGVWAGNDLRAVAAMGVGRAGWDMTLPGEIWIPELVRACAYRESPRWRAWSMRRPAGSSGSPASCSAVLSFPEYPATPVSCPNPDRLRAHPFMW
jgi:hypothetical protein